MSRHKDLRSDLIWNAQLSRFAGLARVRASQSRTLREKKSVDGFRARHVTMAVALPNDVAALVDAKAKSAKESRADFLRRAVLAELHRSAP